MQAGGRQRSHWQLRTEKMGVVFGPSPPTPNTHTHRHMCVHTHAHTCTDTCTCTHMHTHAHTYTVTECRRQMHMPYRMGNKKCTPEIWRFQEALARPCGPWSRFPVLSLRTSRLLMPFQDLLLPATFPLPVLHHRAPPDKHLTHCLCPEASVRPPTMFLRAPSRCLVSCSTCVRLFCAP